MPNGLAVVAKKTIPFLFSFLIHALIVTVIYSFTASSESLIQIDVEIKKSASSSASNENSSVSSASQKQKNQSPKFADKNFAANKISVINNSPAVGATTSSELPGEGSNGNRETTLLGSDVGIQTIYPRLSRVLKETGTATIAVENNKATVFESSGFVRLDNSALQSTEQALQNGLLKQATANHSKLKIRFVFRLLN